MTGVSGGSFTAAYLGLHGRGHLRGLRAALSATQRPECADRPAPGALELGAAGVALLRAQRSDRALLRSDPLRRLDLRGPRGPQGGPLVQINATDLATGAPFSFIQDQFDFLCSELGSYPISRAVAASSAVPGPMSPLTLRNFAGQCSFEADGWIRSRSIPAGPSVGPMSTRRIWNRIRTRTRGDSSD